MAQYIRSKSHTPASINYNALQTIALGTATLTASQANTIVVQRSPLPFSIKIIAVAVVPSGSLAGTASFNIVSGEGTYSQGSVPTTDQRLSFPAIFPSATAQPGQALFSADQAINLVTAGLVQTFYPALFDAIWPTGTDLTLRIATNSSAAGSLTFKLAVVPVDNNGNTNAPFIPGPTTL